MVRNIQTLRVAGVYLLIMLLYTQARHIIWVSDVIYAENTQLHGYNKS